MKSVSHNPYHRCFETLANELRLDIVKALSKKEMCVTDLAEKLGVERSRVSHSLSLLKRCTIAHSKQEGKKQIYYLDSRLVKMLKNDTLLVALSNYMDNCRPICGGTK